MNCRSSISTTTRSVLLAASLLIAGCGGAWGQTVHALIVGINDYASGKALRGAVSDAEDIALALEQVGINKVTVLLDREATRERITAEWRRMVAAAAPGDTLLFTFAGHGAQEPERVPGSERDGRDEVLVLGGFKPYGPATRERIFDDELRAWFADAGRRDLQVLFVADACHSGTLTRGVDPRAEQPTYRVSTYQIEDELLEIDVPAAEEPVDAESMHVTYLAAGLDDEKVPELNILDRTGRVRPRGALSYAFARALEGAADRDEDRTLTRAELERYVVESVRRHAEARHTPDIAPRSDWERQVLVLPDPLGDPLELDDPSRIRIAVLNGGPAAAAVAGALQRALVVARSDAPDLLWDAATGELVSGLGDVIAFDIEGPRLQGVIDKAHVLPQLAEMSDRDSLVMRVLPKDERHVEGSKITLDISGFARPYVTVFSLSGDGTVHFLYPTKSRDALRVSRANLEFETKVTPPFGADHVVAVATGRPLPSLHRQLSALDQRVAPRVAMDVLALALENEPYQMGLQGLFTGP